MDGKIVVVRVNSMLLANLASINISFYVPLSVNCKDFDTLSLKDLKSAFVLAHQVLELVSAHMRSASSKRTPTKKREIYG